MRKSISGRSLVMAVLLSGLLAGCGTLSTYGVDSGNFEAMRYAGNSDLQFEVDSLAKPLIDNKETPGLIVGVLLDDGKSRFFSYGVAGKEMHTALNAETLFDVGSLSKVVLGCIAAQLVDEGVLSWNMTLAEALPDDVVLSNDAKSITLQDLATHTSGLPRQPYDFRTMAYFVEYLFTGNNFYRHFDEALVFGYLAEFVAPKKREPVYSNIGYGLLGYIVERFTNKSLEALFLEKIAQPLNLNHTGYRLERLGAPLNRAYGYAGDQPKFIARGQPVPDWEMSELMKGSAAMYSSASDLLSFARAYIEAPPVLAAALEDTLQVRFPRQNEAAAIAWVADSINDYEVFYQTGMIAGYTAFIGLDMKHRQAVVMLQNSFNWSANIGYRLLVRLGNAQEIRKARNK